MTIAPDVDADPARDILAEAVRLGETAEGAAAILAHSLAFALEQLELARNAVSHGFVRASLYQSTKGT